jgi:hypothetical protein
LANCFLFKNGYPGAIFILCSTYLFFFKYYYYYHFLFYRILEITRRKKKILETLNRLYFFFLKSAVRFPLFSWVSLHWVFCKKKTTASGLLRERHATIRVCVCVLFLCCDVKVRPGPPLPLPMTSTKKTTLFLLLSSLERVNFLEHSVPAIVSFLLGFSSKSVERPIVAQMSYSLLLLVAISCACTREFHQSNSIAVCRHEF